MVAKSPFKHQNKVLVNPSEDYVNQFTWEEIGDITVQQTALAVDGSDWDTINALAATNKLVYYPNNGTVAFEVRFRCDVNAGDNVVNLYAMAGDDYARLVGTLTCTQGTLEYSATEFFCEEIVQSVENWISTTSVVCETGGANNMASLVINAHGYDRFIFVATTLLAGKTLTLDVRRM